MNLDELTSQQKKIIAENNALGKERRILAEKYKYHYDKYNNMRKDDSENIISLKNKLDEMMERARYITNKIDSNTKKLKIFQKEIDSFK